MNPEELEGRSNSELIDLILQQHRHIEQLQAQLAALQTQLAQLQAAARKNGSDLDSAASAAAQSVPAGRFPLAFKLMLFAAGVLTCAIVLIIANFRPNALVSVGRAADYQPGSVTAMHLPAPNRGDQAIPIFLVNDPSAGFLALYRQSLSSGCQIEWYERAGWFEDPCNGAKFTRTGDHLEGPSPRGLDRFTVVVADDGNVSVDVNALQAGRPKP